MRNTTKKKLREGKAVVGAAVQLDHPSTTKIMAQAGFDFLVIDTQHSPFGPEAVYRLIDSLSPTDSEIIVRVLRNDIALIGHVLDFGADGVIMPLTNTVEDFERAVGATRYPPDGTRSWGPRKTERYGGSTEYAVRANEEILASPQIETIEAVNNLDSLLKVKGVDGIMVGPADLGLSIRRSSAEAIPEVDELIGRILDKCKENGVPFGIFASDLKQAEKWLGLGGQMATVGGDPGFLMQGVAQTVGDAQEMLSRVDANR